MHWADKVLAEHPEWSIAVVHLRTLVPLDYALIESEVTRCNRVIVYHEDTLFGGIGGEIAAHISEHLFEHLDAPVARVGSLDTPVPFSSMLEAQFLPKMRLVEAIERVLAY